MLLGHLFEKQTDDEPKAAGVKMDIGTFQLEWE